MAKLIDQEPKYEGGKNAKVYYPDFGNQAVGVQMVAEEKTPYGNK